MTKNLIPDNSNKLRESEQFRKVILNQDLSKEDREECEKLFTDKVIKINKKGGSSKWVVRIGDNLAPSITFLFFDLWFDFWWIEQVQFKLIMFN